MRSPHFDSSSSSSFFLSDLWLVIDEVVQVLRHLLTSSTCRKDGKLPALLTRLRQLVQIARRVIPQIIP